MVREHLISAATSFLCSDQVQSHPDETKRKFLVEKGLSDEEIVAAFARSRVPQGVQPSTTQYNDLMDRCLREGNFAKNKCDARRPTAPLVLVAAVSTAAIGVVVYLYRLFRRYLWPWLVRQWKQGTAEKEEKEEAVELEMKEIVSSQMYELHDTIASIKAVLDQQQSQISDLARKDPGAVNELRKELESVKKLLLSKDSFPQPPVSQLPSWQIRRHNSKQETPAPTSIAPGDTVVPDAGTETSARTRPYDSEHVPTSNTSDEGSECGSKEGSECSSKEGSECSSKEGSECGGNVMVNLDDLEAKLLYSQCLSDS